MSISPSDVLFAWDASHGIAPTVGGEPSFSRGGEKWGRTRRTGGGPLYGRARGDQLLHPWWEKGGVALPRRTLDVSEAVTPASDDSAKFDPADSVWSAGTVTVGEVESVFVEGGFSGWEVVKDQSGGMTLRQNYGVWSGGVETALLIVESNNTEGFGARMRDLDAGVVVAEVDIDFGSGTITVQAGDAWLLYTTRNGPNGRRLMVIALAGSGTSGNTRRIDTRWDGTSGQNVIHHLYHGQEIPWIPAPTPYVGSPVSVPGDGPVQFDRGPFPQSFAVYWWGIAMMAPHLLNVPIIGQESGAVNESWRIRKRAGSGNEDDFGADARDVDGRFIGADVVVPPDPGALLELIGIFDLDPSSGDPTLRMIGAKDRAVVAGNSGTNADWVLPDDWQFPPVSLGGANDVERALHGRVLIAALSALDSWPGGTDQEIVDELADVPIGPHRAGHG